MVQYTRKDYLNKLCTHSEYYAQFGGHLVQATVLRKYSEATLRRRMAEDRHLNNLPLAAWDAMANSVKLHVCAINKRLNGSHSASLSDCVCTLKEAARHIATRAGA